MNVLATQRRHHAGPDGQDDMPWLMGVGPVTTSRAVKAQMLADWEGRDPLCRAMVERVRHGLLSLAGAGPEHEVILVEGSADLALECALSAVAPEGRRRKTLVLSNGADGERIAMMLDRLRRPFSVLARDERKPFDAAELDAVLVDDADVVCLSMVQSEQASGLVNDLSSLAGVARTRGRTVVADATHGFGALPLAIGAIDALVAAPHRCLESVPGFAFVICRRDALEAARAAPSSLSLDLAARLADGPLPFTAHQAVAACAQALRELEAEGGPAGRLERYGRVRALLVDGMRCLGFEPLLEGESANPAIGVFSVPDGLDFPAFESGLRRRGFVIAPGALVLRPSLRVSIAGRIGERAVRGFLDAVRDVMRA
jgi:2-aminoethylphosphonate-pyruvate transaminase